MIPEQTIQRFAEGIQEGDVEKMLSTIDRATRESLEQGTSMQLGGMDGISLDTLTKQIQSLKDRGFWPSSVAITVNSISPEGYTTADIIEVNVTMTAHVMGADEVDNIPLAMKFEDGQWLISFPDLDFNLPNQ